MTYKEIKPAYELVKKYFGTNHSALTLDLQCSHFDNEELRMDIHISQEEIRELVERHFETEGIPVDEICDTLWLNANAGYDRYYEKYEEWQSKNIDELVGSDVLYWDVIKKELIELYALLNRESRQPIYVSFEDDSVEISNVLNWFPAFFQKFCFSELIPDITSAEQAKSILSALKAKSSGHPVTRKLENSIVFGISNIAQDYNLVKGKAPKNLRLFIWEYMCLMKVISPDDVYVTDLWIKTQISQLKNYKTSPVLETNEAERVTLDSLKGVGTEGRKIDYLTKKEPTK